MVKFHIVKIIQAEHKDYPLIQEFLLPHEFSCVTLCSHVRKNDDNIFVATNDDSITDVKSIFAVLYFDKTILHCIPEINHDFLECFSQFAKDKPVKAINGEGKNSELLVNALAPDLIPYQTNKYTLMVLESSCAPVPETHSCDVEVKRCTEDDLEILFPLQKQYIIKEVAPAGKSVTDLECKVSLRQILKNQLCFALYDDGELVAKVNTNAIGWNYVQIGGVYTHPLFRRNHYAWRLLKTLTDRILKTQKKVSLYVKFRNNPALNLYKGLGFQEKLTFQISYFN